MKRCPFCRLLGGFHDDAVGHHLSTPDDWVPIHQAAVRGFWQVTWRDSRGALHTTAYKAPKDER